MKGPNRKQGFTLIEMIVAISIFTLVLFIAMSAFLSVVDGDHKTRATRIATDNLSLTLEDMSRKIKTGSFYNCTGASSGTADCTVTASTILSFTSQDGFSRVIYKRGVGPGAIVNGSGASGCGNALFVATQGCILREDSGFSKLATSPEINITGLKFYVYGTAPCGVSPCVYNAGTPTDAQQPIVVVMIDGALSASTAAFVGNEGFKIQTTITQRVYDN